MLFPNYRVEIGSETFDPDSQSVVGFNVKLSLGPKVDSFELLLAKDDRSLKVTRNDPVNVFLGYEDDVVKVFSGLVETVERGISTVRVFGLAFSVNLLLFRTNKVYVNQTAGQIVSDLLSSLKQRVKGITQFPVEEGQIMDGVSFPVYVVDSRLSAYEHMEKLAKRSNYVFYISSENKFYFKKYEGGEVQVLKYGKDVIEVNVTKMVGQYDSVIVYGESPSSWSGGETYHWLSKREVLGLASYSSTEGQKEVSRGHLLAMQDPVIKDGNTASTTAENLSNIVNRELQIVLRIIGNSKLKVNDTIKVEDLEGEVFNSQLRVIEVEHYLSKLNGFTSIITCVPEEKAL